MEQQIVYEMLSKLVEGWENVVVRIRQDGKLQFLPLSEVKDQRQLFKLVRDLLKQAAQRNGLVGRG